jgi:NADPH-dependent curcumin reductase CurA
LFFDIHEPLLLTTITNHAYIGLTAYASLKDIGKPKAGETIFISAASGAVGTVLE